MCNISDRSFAVVFILIKCVELATVCFTALVGFSFVSVSSLLEGKLCQQVTFAPEPLLVAEINEHALAALEHVAGMHILLFHARTT